MASYDFTDKSNAYGVQAATASAHTGGLCAQRVVIDAALQNIAATDTVSAMDLKAGTYVLGVVARCITADATATDIDFGTTGSATAFITGANLATANATAGVGLAAPEYISADTKLLLTFGAGASADTMKLEIVVFVLEASDVI